MSEACTWLELAAGRVHARHWLPAAGAPPTRAPILLLHDSLGSVARWREFPQALADASGRAVIAYDRLGFGRSDRCFERPGPDFIAEEAAVRLPPILGALGLSRVVLLGHSVGGAMALAAAALLGERVEAVITEGAQAFVEARTLAGIRAALTRFDQPGALDRLAAGHQQDPERARWVLEAWAGVWLDPEFADWSLDAELPRVRCPVLVVHGAQNDYGSAAFPQRIAALAGGPVQCALLPAVGHVPHREVPEDLLRLTCDFLQRSHARQALLGAWSTVGAASADAAARIDVLLNAWAQPHRHYHTLEHLAECLDWLHEPAVLALAVEPAELVLALGYHDVVYDVHRHDNEERSAELAVSELTACGVPSHRVQRISALILATRHDAAPQTPDQALLIDIDLSILGAQPDRFAAYDQQIRAEFAFVPMADYRKARGRILAQFLARPILFHTAALRDALETRARANLVAAIANLDALA